MSELGRAIFTIVLLAGAAATGAAAQTPAAPATATDDAVRAVLDRRCAECHGPDVDGPAGNFGHVLDLKRLIDDGKIVPGDPDASELYLTIDYGEMPDEDATNGPVTPDELAMLRQWIADGAVVTASAAPIATDGDSDDAELPRAVALLGRFHPAAVHFPIALLIAALLAELIGLCGWRASMRPVVGFAMALAVPASVVSVTLGLILEESITAVGRRGEMVEQHEWLGISVAVLTVAAAVVLLLSGRGRSARWRWVFRVLLLLAAIGVGLTGHLGGLISNGLDWYSV